MSEWDYWKKIVNPAYIPELEEVPQIVGYDFDRDATQLWEDCNRDIIVFMQELSSQMEGTVLLYKIGECTTPSGFWAPTYLVTSSDTMLDAQGMWDKMDHSLVDANITPNDTALKPTNIPGVFKYVPWMGRTD